MRPGQSESDVVTDWNDDPLPTLFEVLAIQTTTPDDCYFCVWEGFGQTDVVIEDRAVYVDAGTDPALMDPDARPGWRPAPIASPTMPYLPKVVVPNRAYWLFRGPLVDVGSWDTAEEWLSPSRLGGAQPAFVWPADHAWCVASDVDPHWAGIAGTPALISRLVTDPRLDVVPANPAEEQPYYR